MRCHPPFVYMYVCMYVYMYIRPSQPETPRLHNSPMFSAGAHDNITLYLAAISHKTAQHSTSSLHAAFRLLLTSLIAPGRATRLLAILPYWLMSFAPRSWNTFTVPSGRAHNTHCVTGFPAQLQICRCRLPSCHPVLRLACYPFILTASESRLQFYCLKCTCPGRVTLMHCTLQY